ncbi:MAG TPA: hypothetical protein V6D12_07615 [Candidatus Obscuribacterales bacterium]
MKIQPVSKKFLAAVSAGLAASLILGSTSTVYAQVPLPSISNVVTRITTTVQRVFSSSPLITFSLASAAKADLVISTISEKEVASIIAGSQNQGGVRIAGANMPVEFTQPISASTQVVLASSDAKGVSDKPTPISPQEAVLGLHQTFSQAFIASGLSSSEADKNATNLVTALAAVKSSYNNNGDINAKKVNHLVRLIEPSRAALPGMLRVVSNNPNPETFQQIQDTVSSLETVGGFVKQVNDNSF